MQHPSIATMVLVGVALALPMLPSPAWGYQQKDTAAADTTTPPLAKIYDSTAALGRLKKKLPRAQFVKRSKAMGLLVDKVISGVGILQSKWIDGGVMPPNDILTDTHHALHAASRSLRIGYVNESLPELRRAIRLLGYYQDGKSPEEARAIEDSLAKKNAKKKKPARK
jgi:hypothetical protein